jgi:RNA polymerase sigma-70 factor (ECF subfamily)
MSVMGDTAEANPDGAETAFAVLFRREFRPIARSVFLVVGDAATAEEIVQEAFAKAWSRWREVSRAGRPGAWIQTVAVRMALRKRSRRRRGAELEAFTARLDDRDGGDHSVVPVLELLRSLTPTQRAVVALAIIDDLPIDEVARRVGCRPSTARVHLHRARARLAELVRQEIIHGE